MNTQKILLATAISATLLGTSPVKAALVTGIMGNGTWSTNHANFTMLFPTGGTVGGTNNVNMYWDGNAFNSSSDYSNPGSNYTNLTASSTTSFYGHLWTAHDIQVFVPGSYSFDTSLGGGATEYGMLDVDVPVDHLGMHMLFDWNGVNNLDVFVVLAPNSMYGSGVVRTSGNYTSCDSGEIKNCLWGSNSVTGFAPTTNQVWTLATVDGNGDGIMGTPLHPSSPFVGFNIGFNANLDFTPAPVPISAAVWLFGSGLIGLLGVARRQKQI